MIKKILILSAIFCSVVAGTATAQASTAGEKDTVAVTEDTATVY